MAVGMSDRPYQLDARADMKVCGVEQVYEGQFRRSMDLGSYIYGQQRYKFRNPPYKEILFEHQ